MSLAKAAIASASVTSSDTADMFGRPAIAASSFAGVAAGDDHAVAGIFQAMHGARGKCPSPAGDEDDVAVVFMSASFGVVRRSRYPYTLRVDRGTRKCHSYPKERFGFSAMPTPEKIAYDPNAPVDPRVETLVNELIGRVADKWNSPVLEELEDHGTCRFTELSRRVPGISQKMLTQTLRQMDRHGLLVRTVHPVVPPAVEYCLTDLGQALRRSLLRESGCGRRPIWKKWLRRGWRSTRADEARTRSRWRVSTGSGLKAFIVTL